MELNHLRKLSEPKKVFSVAYYESVVAKMQTICDKEGIKPSNLLRNLLNEFIDQYNNSTKGE